jgi:hypothetical protein
VKWRNFDPGQFVRITTLVASPVEVKPEISGNIFGVRLAEAVPKGPYPKFIVYASTIGFALLFGVIAFSGFSTAVKAFQERNVKSVVINSVAGTVFSVLSVLSLFALVWLLGAPTVP